MKEADLQITCFVADTIDAMSSGNIHLIRYLIYSVREDYIRRNNAGEDRELTRYLNSLVNGLGGVDAAYRNNNPNFDQITPVLATWHNVLVNKKAKYELKIMEGELKKLDTSLSVPSEGEENLEGEWWRKAWSI